MALSVTVPVSTEVIEANPDCTIRGAYEQGVLMITIDTRYQNHHQRLGLDITTRLHWGQEHEFEAQELSGLAWPIRYRVRTRDGYDENDQGQRVHFTTRATGIDSRRGVSQVLMRAAVLLVVIAGVGSRRAAWLLQHLFQVETSKSAVQRWIQEIAAQLPSADELIRQLDAKQPMTEAHFDELFPRGTAQCVLVLKDEHGRIVATQAIDKREEASVTPFLQRLQALWGCGCRRSISTAGPRMSTLSGRCSGRPSRSSTTPSISSRISGGICGSGPSRIAASSRRTVRR